MVARNILELVQLELNYIYNDKFSRKLNNKINDCIRDNDIVYRISKKGVNMFLEGSTKARGLDYKSENLPTKEQLKILIPTATSEMKGFTGFVCINLGGEPVS